VTEESETAPTRPSAQVLLETERIILKGGGIVARLAGIYGPDRSALLRKFLSGEGVRDDDRFVNQVHRDDIASALFLLLNQQSLPERVFNVVDNNPILRCECYRWLAQELNRPVPNPTKSTRLRGAPARQAPSSPSKRGESNKRVSNARLRALGWKPHYSSFAEGMKNSVLPASRKLL
jgi:nucleoside-diphosphate-sugar epimerase